MPLHLRTLNGGGDPPRRANGNRTWIPEKLLTLNLGSSLGELGLCWLSHLLQICEGAISQLPPQPSHVLDIGGTQGSWDLRFATPPRSANHYLTNGGRLGARLSREQASGSKSSARNGEQQFGRPLGTGARRASQRSVLVDYLPESLAAIP